MLRKPEEKSNQTLEENLFKAVLSSEKDNTKDLRTAIDEIFAKRDYINNLIQADPSSKGRLIAPSLDTVRRSPSLLGEEKRGPALNLAVRNHKEDALKLLIEAGADVNLCDEFDSTRGRNFENLHSFRHHMDMDFGFREFINIAGCTPLAIAVKNSDINCMTLLLDNGADIHQRSSDRETPFTIATNRLNAECMKLLIDKGANINQRDLKGHTPLTLATSRHDEKCMNFLIDKKANIDQRDSDGETPFIIATNRLDAECMKFLIDKGANINLKDSKGNTPLMLATKRGSIAHVEMLLTARANVTAKNGYFGLFGKTALQMAQEQDPPICVEMLLKAQKEERAKGFFHKSTSSVQHERKQESQDSNLYNKLSPGPSYSNFDP